MPIQQLIAPQQNSLIDTFLQAQQIQGQRSKNALYEAQAAELPYEREREAALNNARIDASKALTDQRRTDIGYKTAEWVLRNPGDEKAVMGALEFASRDIPAMKNVIATLEPLRGTPAFAQTAGNLAMSVKDRFAQQMEQQKFTETQKQSGIDNQFQQANLGVAQGHLGVSQAGLGERQRHNQVMENRPQAGFNLHTNPDGTVSASFGTPARNELEKKVLSEEDALARLAEIENSANPQNLTYQNQVKNTLLDVKSKLGGEMSPEQAQFRDSMTDTRQVTLTNLNKTIHELSGTAMGVKEADRIMATMPNMDDAPDVFARKLLNATRMTREAIARHKGALGQQPGAAPPPNTARTAVTAVPQPTQKDFEYTAAKHGITIEEVKRRMSAP